MDLDAVTLHLDHRLPRKAPDPADEDELDRRLVDALDGVLRDLPDPSNAADLDLPLRDLLDAGPCKPRDPRDRCDLDRVLRDQMDGRYRKVPDDAQATDADSVLRESHDRGLRDRPDGRDSAESDVVLLEVRDGPGQNRVRAPDRADLDPVLGEWMRPLLLPDRDGPDALDDDLPPRDVRDPGSRKRVTGADVWELEAPLVDLWDGGDVPGPVDAADADVPLGDTTPTVRAGDELTDRARAHASLPRTVPGAADAPLRDLRDAGTLDATGPLRRVLLLLDLLARHRPGARGGAPGGAPGPLLARQRGTGARTHTQGLRAVSSTLPTPDVRHGAPKGSLWVEDLDSALVKGSHGARRKGPDPVDHSDVDVVTP